MTQKRRHDIIRARINEDGQVDVGTLADQLGVSHETIRRDLSALAAQGELRKTHGGAVRAQSNFEQAFTERLHSNHREKEAIGRRAAQILSPGDTMFIDSGTTTLAFAEQIGSIANLTVFTNAPLIAKALWERNRTMDIYLLGGHYAGDYMETLGHMVLAQMKDFHVDHAFIGAGAVHPELGIMDQHHDEAVLARQMLRQSRHHVVLADRSKIGQRGLTHVVGFDDIDLLITNSFDNPELTQALDQHNVRLFCCDPA